MTARRLIEDALPEDFRVRLKVAGDKSDYGAGEGAGDEMTWAEFADANQDLTADFPKILQELNTKGTYTGGGGADVQFTLEKI